MFSQPALTLVVSIINFRTGDLTISCIKSILNDLSGILAQIVVVDNCSNDGSAHQIESWIAAQNPAVPVSLLHSPTNTGFSGGHNQGIAANGADFHLILNSDTIVRPGFFRSLLDAAASNPNVGLFAPRVEYDDGVQQVSCFRFASPISELIRGAASSQITQIFSRFEVPLAMPPQSNQIGWVSFACILLRATMISDVGPMDEGYFLYFEDAEYCWRADKKGWKIAYVHDARVVHFRGGSGPVKSLQHEKKRLPKYYYESRTRFFYQTYGWFGLLSANALWTFGRGLAQLRRFLGKSVPTANKGEILDIWTNALSPLGNNSSNTKR